MAAVSQTIVCVTSTAHQVSSSNRLAAYVVIGKAVSDARRVSRLDEQGERLNTARHPIMPR